jgi:hypothetical protein
MASTTGCPSRSTLTKVKPLFAGAGLNVIFYSYPVCNPTPVSDFCFDGLLFNHYFHFFGLIFVSLILLIQQQVLKVLEMNVWFTVPVSKKAGLVKLHCLLYFFQQPDCAWIRTLSPIVKCPAYLLCPPNHAIFTNLGWTSDSCLSSDNGIFTNLYIVSNLNLIIKLYSFSNDPMVALSIVVQEPTSTSSSIITLPICGIFKGSVG